MSRIHIEIIYPYAVDLVWEALTQPEALKQWHMDNDFLPIVGHKFQFRGRANKHWKGILDTEVLEVEKPSRLVYSCRGYDANTSTIITWNLEPSGTGTKVTLEQTGFEGAGGFILSKLIIGPGWRKLAGKYLPIVLEHMKRNGLNFEKGKWLIADMTLHSAGEPPG